MTAIEMIEIGKESLLEFFNDGAALIGPDRRIVKINAALAVAVGEATSGPCYQTLAGLHYPCPFCPFEKLITGNLVGPIEASQRRRGKDYTVKLMSLKADSQTNFVLESIRPPLPEQSDVSCDARLETQGGLLLKKLEGLLLISRDLMGKAPIDAKFNNLLIHFTNSLDDGSGIAAQLEIDGRSYGDPYLNSETNGLIEDIRVDGVVRGRLIVEFPGKFETTADERYFVQEAADLIGRRIEISDLEEMLRAGEERYRKLSANLKKEMWTRTEALMKETGYLEGILRSSEDMIITTDLNSRIVEFNPEAEKMLGYSAEEIQGNKIGDLWEDASERERILDEVIESGGIRNYQTRLRTKSGEIKEISLTLSLLKDEEGKILGTVGVSKDIARELAINRELERLNQNYMETIHFINHENKNSLIVISGFVKRLLVGENDASKKEQLSIVYHHAKFLEAMSRDFLVMAELERGEFQVRKEVIENFYEEVILPAMTGLKERYPDSFQSYDDSMGGVGPIRLMGSPRLLEIVYRNLFGNALKYRSPNGKIAYGMVETPDSYIFNVWNEGPGVPQNEIDNIFDKFYRVHDELTKGKRGTGLGLYNIRRIIEAHGGRIWCETVTGDWINFLFSIPKMIA
jgi:PAS domain S-box-containing protein